MATYLFRNNYFVNHMLFINFSYGNLYFTHPTARFFMAVQCCSEFHTSYNHVFL
jgi:hypothetical protein